MREIISIFLRYLIVLLMGVSNLFIFYQIFSFPTLYASYYLISLKEPAQIIENTIVLNEKLIDIKNSCVSGSAYYLLFILSMSFSIPFLKRIKLISFLFFSFFLLNVFRIFFMAIIINENFFEDIHLFLWKFFSTLFVILLWFSAVYLFKIKEVPFYSDFKKIRKVLIKNENRNRKKE
ncbi:MAG: pacearchaeosortase [Candidatus Pacearchaeota archaeon]